MKERVPRQFILGEHYIIYYSSLHKMVCKFIKVTACGYNFLNISTNKCVFNKHLYVSKCINHSSNDWFWINKQLKIERLN